jgi:hypothetical protein
LKRPRVPFLLIGWHDYSKSLLSSHNQPKKKRKKEISKRNHRTWFFSNLSFSQYPIHPYSYSSYPHERPPYHATTHNTQHTTNHHHHHRTLLLLIFILFASAIGVFSPLPGTSQGKKGPWKEKAEQGGRKRSPQSFFRHLFLVASWRREILPLFFFSVLVFLFLFF